MYLDSAVSSAARRELPSPSGQPAASRCHHPQSRRRAPFKESAMAIVVATRISLEARFGLCAAGTKLHTGGSRGDATRVVRRSTRRHVVRTEATRSDGRRLVWRETEKTHILADGGLDL